MRFGLAAFGAVLIGGIAVGLAVVGSTDNTKSSPAARSAGCGSRRARFADRLALQFLSGADRPGRTAHDHSASPRHAARARWKANTAFKKVARALAGRERRSIPRPASGQRAGPDERTEEPDAGSDRRTSRGSAIRTAPFRRTPKATSARTTTCSGSTSRCASSTRTGRLRRRSSPATSCSPASRICGSSSPATAATRSSSTTSSPTAGSRASSRIRPIRTGPSTSASRLADGRPDGYMVRATSTSRTRRT